MGVTIASFSCLVLSCDRFRIVFIKIVLFALRLFLLAMVLVVFLTVLLSAFSRLSSLVVTNVVSLGSWIYELLLGLDLVKDCSYSFRTFVDTSYSLLLILEHYVGCQAWTISTVQVLIYLILCITSESIYFIMPFVSLVFLVDLEDKLGEHSFHAWFISKIQANCFV